MKVIIKKDFQKWKANEIVEVADGYAKNFLIKNGHALPINHATNRKRNETIATKKQNEDKNVEVAKKTKLFIESLKPVMYLKVDDTLVVHGSITRKQIIEYLREKGVKLNDSKNVENIKIESLGKTNVRVKVYKDIVATLSIEVEKK